MKKDDEQQARAKAYLAKGGKCVAAGLVQGRPYGRQCRSKAVALRNDRDPVCKRHLSSLPFLTAVDV